MSQGLIFSHFGRLSSFFTDTREYLRVGDNDAPNFGLKSSTVPAVKTGRPRFSLNQPQRAKLKGIWLNNQRISQEVVVSAGLPARKRRREFLCPCLGQMENVCCFGCGFCLWCCRC